MPQGNLSFHKLGRVVFVVFRYKYEVRNIYMSRKAAQNWLITIVYFEFSGSRIATFAYPFITSSFLGVPWYLENCVYHSHDFQNANKNHFVVGRPNWIFWIV